MQGVLLEVVLHVGTLCAVVWLYRADLARMILACLRFRDPLGAEAVLRPAEGVR